MDVTYTHQAEDTVSLQTVAVGLVGTTISAVIRVEAVEDEDGEPDVNLSIHSPLDPSETVELLETLADGIKRAIAANN